MKRLFYVFLMLCCISCQQKNKSTEDHLEYSELEIKYAKGFSIHQFETFTKVIVHSAWQGVDKDFIYILSDQKDTNLPEHLNYDALIQTPIQKLVATSTTHIPSLIRLNQLDKLVGFPNLDYISSKAARQLIDQQKIQELGNNESINTEVLLALQPDVVFSFAIEGQNKSWGPIQNSGIPVVYNGDWLENNPLGKAEWIKFFGVFLGELDQSMQAFEEVESNYKTMQNIAKNQNTKPTVISGAMHQDRWYLPYGNSWLAQFFEDAHADYIYKDTQGKGSIALAFETVFSEAKDAEFWVSPGPFISYKQLLESNPHYAEFDAFQDKNMYTMASTTGETGGVLFYELGPNRPDLVLKDLVKLFHPHLFKNEKFTFFKPLKP